MKRLSQCFLSSLLLAIVASPLAFAANIQPLTALAPNDLLAVTAGVCTTCGSEDPKPSTPPRETGRTWAITSSSAGSTTQISYQFLREYSNATSRTTNHSYAFDDECSQRLTSGGIGISTALNLNVGSTIFCNVKDTTTISVAPRTRVKLYRGLMRTLISYVAKEFIEFSDGTSEPSGRTDRGTMEQRYYRLSTVENPL